jgi:hypothetical protein
MSASAAAAVTVRAPGDRALPSSASDAPLVEPHLAVHPNDPNRCYRLRTATLDAAGRADVPPTAPRKEENR